MDAPGCRIKNGNKHVKKRIVTGSFRVLIPLYLTYIIFLASVFLLFIPHQKKQLLEQKKESIRHLTDSTVSLLAEYEKRIKRNEIDPETARNEAVHQIRHLRYGPEGKDYFWITDYHPFMVMHPYKPELEGRAVTEFRDAKGNYPFLAMVETVLKKRAGYVNYHWQWKDAPGESEPKISYVRGFAPWQWIIGTGVYENDINQEIASITRKFFQIFSGILAFIVLLSLYITIQVIHIEKNKNDAQNAQALEEIRLKKLLELNRLAGQAPEKVTQFAIEEGITLTQSDIGFIAFMNTSGSLLTMHTWSEQTMRECEIKKEQRIYELAHAGLWAEAARTGQPVVINNYPSHEADNKKGVPWGHVPINRVLSIPVFDDDTIVALAGVGNKAMPYNESDIRQLQLMMDGMWKIIQKNRSEKKLKASEERYRLLADNATDGIWILELSTMCFSYASPAMAQLYGYQKDELTGMEMGKHLTKASFERASTIIASEIARDGTPGLDPDRHRILEFEILKNEDSPLCVETKVRLLRDPSGRPDRILGITRDISQRKMVEERLRQTQKMEALGTLAGGIAHDFNNILSSMIGFTELARLKLEKDSDIYRKLDNVLAGGLRARDLIRHILNFSRKADTVKTAVHITPLVKECLKFFRASLSPDIEIRRSINYEEGVIMADPTQMHQVLMNLLTNADHAMKDTCGTLTLELDAAMISDSNMPGVEKLSPGPYVRLDIRDSGKGIPKKLVDKIFEPFFTTKNRGEGTGMGLALVYGIIKEMDGCITVESHPGEGTCFTILIPDRAGVQAPPQIESDPALVMGKGNILLVDDEASIIQWCSNMLVNLGYKAEGFESPRNALERFKETPTEFDLVLTDLTMPGMTGIELAKEIKTIRPELPIILCTGFGGDITLDNIREQGLNDLVMKPMIAGEMSQAVARALENSKGAD